MKTTGRGWETLEEAHRFAIRSWVILAVLGTVGCRFAITQDPSIDGGVGCSKATTAVVSPVYPSNGTNWNDYVKSGAGDVACAGTEDGTAGCLHGGEKRKVRLSGVSSCSQLTASDSLNAFDWVCDSSSGSAVFYSVKLKDGKGLRDLLTVTAFKPVSVSILKSGCSEPIARTASSVWWSNAIRPLPSNPGASDPQVTINSPGSIYVLASSSPSSGYNIDGDRIAVVTLGSSILSYSGSATNNCSATGEVLAGSSKSLLCSGAQNFIWIEATLDGQAGTRADHGIYVAGARFARVHRTFAQHFATDGIALVYGSRSSWISESVSSRNYPWPASGISLDGTSYSALSDSLASDNDNVGVSMNGTSNSRIYRVMSANNRYAAFGALSSALDNIFVQSTAMSGNNGFSVTGVGAGYSTFLMNSSFNTVSDGLYLQKATHNTISGMVVANSGSYGIWFDGNSSATLSDSNVLYDIITSGVGVSNSNGVTIDGLFKKESAQSQCQLFTNPGPVTLDANCNYGPGLSRSAATTPGIGASFLGKVTGDDSRNLSDTNGAAPFASVTDWQNFENPFRAWGAGGVATFPDQSLRGYCEGTNHPNCQIYDWRLMASDMVYRNANGAFVNGGPCPASVDGSVAASILSDQQGRTYLRSAIEIIGDGIGNDNGLCESGEACLFAPNLGSYQGEGDYRNTRCTFKSGTISGVTMYAYPINGVP